MLNVLLVAKSRTRPVGASISLAIDAKTKAITITILTGYIKIGVLPRLQGLKQQALSTKRKFTLYFLLREYRERTKLRVPREVRVQIEREHIERDDKWRVQALLKKS